MKPLHTLDQFDFALPAELIAQHPMPERSASRLLDARGITPVDRVFRELPQLLSPGDLLVFNDTRVIKARLRGFKPSGGAVELLVERVLADHQVLAQLRSSKPARPGSALRLEGAFDAQVLGRGPQPTSHALGSPANPGAGPGAQGPGAGSAVQALYRLQFPEDPYRLLERHGRVPLPPYIQHADGADDERRYQTVFAKHPGAVAAPTAALHFDDVLLAAIRAHGVATAHVTLHVGAGTFQPVRNHDLSAHRMHSERYRVDDASVEAVRLARARGGRVVAVGTTTLRALESAALGVPESELLRVSEGETDIFITPGFPFRVVDQLLTNFHLPKSTLMMLVSAFAGFDAIRHLYAHAIAQRYRFFSYGDAMLLQRKV